MYCRGDSFAVKTFCHRNGFDVKSEPRPKDTGFYGRLFYRRKCRTYTKTKSVNHQAQRYVVGNGYANETKQKKKKRLFFGDSRNASLGFVFGHETEKAVSSPSALRSHTNGNEGGRPDRWMEDGRAKRRVWRIYAERRRALR